MTGRRVRAHRRPCARTQSGGARGRCDRREGRPTLLYDVADGAKESGEMSIRELLIDAPHADRTTTTTTCTPRRSPRPATAASNPARCSTCSRHHPQGCTGSRAPSPSTTGRGCARTRSTWWAPRCTSRPPHRAARTNSLVAIGTDFDVDVVRARVDTALSPHNGARATRASDAYSVTADSASDRRGITLADG